MSSPERRGQRIAAVWFLVSIAGSVLFATAFALGTNTQLQGLGAALACLGIAGALVTASRVLLPKLQTEDLHPSERSPEAEREDASLLLDDGVQQVVGRRTWLVRLGVGALGVLGLAALFPLRSLGPSPVREVGKSGWKAGVRLVRDDGTPVTTDLLDVGSVVTAFPEGHVGPDHETEMASDAVMLVRVIDGSLELPAARKDWAPQGFVAYSKICTHAGCPVALYREGPQQLLCPCHQSTFNVLDGGSVVFGPAARPLPQLPLEVGADGTLRARAGMSDFIGPDAWEHA
ncbi:MAG TPA: Rieske 2Fe-2S domain-containing protein [Candidatus Limnocylindria bacterium]|nr:Rieske 2Fe-2S domain-containing protein [Candidatus Limnocylindria bacterium]